MKSKTPYVLICILMGSLLVACGPSQVELDATSTQIAANIFATQTAAAPTATLTPTPTSEPTRTPTATITPRPLSDTVLTVDDLPNGFSSTSPDEFGLASGNLAYFVSLDPSDESRIEGGFAFILETEEDFEILAGATALIPSRLAQAEFAANLPFMLEAFFFGIGLGVGEDNAAAPEELPDFGVGNDSAGMTSAVDVEGLLMRFDVISFRRDNLAALVMAIYLDGDDPVLPIMELANRLDDRMIEVLNSE